jgi:dTDP-4-dehydrorhamnose reductase
MPIRIAVTGRNGQVVRALSEAAQIEDVLVIPVGRPDLDLNVPKTIETALRAAAPDIVVNAAAYTAVDQAEREPELATLVNAKGAGAVAAVARFMCLSFIFRLTMFSMVRKRAPTSKRIRFRQRVSMVLRSLRANWLSLPLRATT